MVIEGGLVYKEARHLYVMDGGWRAIKKSETRSHARRKKVQVKRLLSQQTFIKPVKGG